MLKICDACKRREHMDCSRNRPHGQKELCGCKVCTKTEIENQFKIEEGLPKRRRKRFFVLLL